MGLRNNYFARMRYLLVILTALVVFVMMVASYHLRTKLYPDLKFIHDSPRSLTSVMDGKVMKSWDSSGANNTALHAILKERASWNGTIILSSVDSGYVDLAINLYLTSIRRHNIDNYLFVGSDPDVCVTLSLFNITCFDYIHDRNGTHPSEYSTQEFKRKTHLKTKIALEALQLGITVLIADVDIVFLKNPLPLLNCQSCDIELSSDISEGNSGFYLARPTAPVIELHLRAWKQGLAKPQISNQKAIDRIMEKMQKDNKITVKNLNPKVYANGKVYFEDGKRMFKGDNPCADCVIVHNNWIVSGAAKVYRFRENGLWESSMNGYYSDEKKKYIQFALPKDFGKNATLSAEINSLTYALIIGEILNRIVILPRFHCYGCRYHPACRQKGARCTLGAFYKISVFDDQLQGKYRENVFLSHSKVPDSIKESLSPLYLIETRINQYANLPAGVTRLTPENPLESTTEELLHWFGNNTQSVLRFHSLYYEINNKVNNTRTSEIAARIKRAFRKSDYRQLKG